MDEIVKKVYGKLVDSGEESGWINLQIERDKEKKVLENGLFYMDKDGNLCRNGE